MKCPNCGSAENYVAWTRDTTEGITRGRDCKKCGKRFNTKEALAEVFDRARELREASEAFARAVLPGE